MTPLLRIAVANARRHRVQTLVLACVSLLACTTGVLALNLRTLTDAPYDRAFDAQNGAHLTMTFASGSITNAQLDATTHAPAVSAAAGPWTVVTTAFDVASASSSCPPRPQAATSAGKGGGGGGGGCGGARIEGRTVLGRSDPGGHVDRLDIVSGRWPSAPGEIALRQLLADALNVRPGDHITASTAPGSPQLTVTGVAAGVDDGVDGWMTPDGASRLTPPAQSHDVRMAYRLHSASSASDISSARDEITAAAPPHSVEGAVSWLDVKRQHDLTVEVMTPFLLAFSLLGIGAVGLVVVNAVGGVVAAARRDIGVMKSLGVTPGGVTAVMVLATFLPVLAGTVAGAPLGIVVSQPLLAKASEAFDLPYSFGVSPAAIAVVVAALLAIAALAAAIPAIAAGRTSAAEALSAGLAPRRRVTATLWRRIAALGLPRPLALGAADSVVRPARSAVTFVAIVTGVSAVVFATGLTASLERVRDAAAGPANAQVSGVIAPNADTATAEHAIAAAPGVQRVATATEVDGAVPGDSSDVRVDGWQTDASWLGYLIVDGSWLSGPGEAVVPSQLQRTTGLHVGDVLTLHAGTTVLHPRVVGVYFDPNDRRTVHVDARDLTGVSAATGIDAPATRIDIGLAPGADPHAVLTAASPLNGVRLSIRGADVDGTAFAIIDSVLVGLTAIIAAVAALGVLNTVALSTRERQKHLAVLRAIGMEPRQVVTMVVTTTAVLGVIAGAVAIPAGIALHRTILGAMADIANSDAPSALYHVYSWTYLPALALSGVVIAALGAMAPARWIARQPAAAMLRAE